MRLSQRPMSDLQHDIVGFWSTAAPAGTVRVVLAADGSGDFNGTAGTWRLDGHVLTIGNDTRMHSFDAAIADGELLLTARFLPQPLRLQRLDPDAGMPAAAAPLSPAEALVGRWQGTQGVAVFNADGSAVLAGTRIAYTADESAITLSTSEGPVRLLYAVEGRRLSLGAGGDISVLMRIDGDAGAVDAAEPAPPPAPRYSKEDALAIQQSMTGLTPEQLRASTIEGILRHGRTFGNTLATLAALLDHQGPLQEQFEQSRLLYVHWLAGARLTDRADEDELRVNELVSVMNEGGDQYAGLARIATQAVLALPRDHPLRDLAQVGHALLGHIVWCETNGQPDLEVLSISDLLNLTLESPGLVADWLAAELVARGESRLDQAEEATRRRFRTAVSGYYTGLAIQARDAEDEEALASHAQQAEDQLALIQTTNDEADEALRRSWLLLAGVHETRGRLADAADLYAKAGAIEDGIGGLAAISEGRLRLQLGEPRRTVTLLTPLVPALERDYLTALEDDEIASSGEQLSNVVLNLAFAHARLDQWDSALRALDRSKNLRFRHRAALREDPAGRQLLEIERALYGLSRGAVVVSDPSQSYKAGDDQYAQVSLRTHLLEEYRKQRPGVQSDILEPPSVRTIAGLLEPDEAVAVIGISYVGLLLCVIFPGDEAAPGGRRLDEAWPLKRLWGLAGEKGSGWMYVMSAPEGYRGVGHRQALVRLLPALEEPVGAPLAAMLRGRGVRRLTIVPHRWLHQAPLWALPSLAPYRVVMSPSAANFVHSRRADTTARRTVLAVADPTLDLPVSPAETGSIDRHLSGAGWTVATLRREQATEAAITRATPNASLLHFCGHGRSDLLRPTRSSLLVHPERELLRRLGPEPFTPLMAQIQDWESSSWDGRYAAVPGRGRLYEIVYPEPDTRERFLEYNETGTLWGRYHGDRLVRLAELWRAGDLLVDDSLSGCRMAFLSACEAGGGALAARDVDEAMGLPAAMHLAGVSTLICSLWPVSDIFTALYVDLFYEGFAAAGARIDVPELVGSVGSRMRDMTRADAAQRLAALRRLAADPKTRFRLEAASATMAAGDEHPFGHAADWAAFYVMGAPVIHLSPGPPHGREQDPHSDT